MPTGPLLKEALERLTQTFELRNTRYGLMDGLALAIHGRPRATRDIDSILSLPPMDMAPLLESLAAAGFTTDLAKNVRELQDDGYTAISFEGLTVDLMRPVLAAQQHVLDRAVRHGRLRVVSAEKLIVLKLMAMRPQDEADIRELLLAYGGKLELEFVRAELNSSADADDLRRARFEAWVREAADADHGG